MTALKRSDKWHYINRSKDTLLSQKYLAQGAQTSLEMETTDWFVL